MCTAELPDKLLSMRSEIMSWERGLVKIDAVNKQSNTILVIHTPRCGRADSCCHGPLLTRKQRENPKAPQNRRKSRGSTPMWKTTPSSFCPGACQMKDRGRSRQQRRSEVPQWTSAIPLKCPRACSSSSSTTPVFLLLLSLFLLSTPAAVRHSVTWWRALSYASRLH